MPRKIKDLVDDDGEVLLAKAQLDAVQIDEQDLDAEFTELPGELAYWNALYAKANQTFLIERHEHRVTEAKLRLMMREEHKDDKPKPTNDDIMAYVHTHKEYIESHRRYVEAEANKLRTMKFAEAVYAKKDMLQSLGAKLRAEMEGTPAMRHKEKFYDDSDDD